MWKPLEQNTTDVYYVHCTCESLIITSFYNSLIFFLAEKFGRFLICNQSKNLLLNRIYRLNINTNHTINFYLFENFIFMNFIPSNGLTSTLKLQNRTNNNNTLKSTVTMLHRKVGFNFSVYVLCMSITRKFANHLI